MSAREYNNYKMKLLKIKDKHELMSQLKTLSKKEHSEKKNKSGYAQDTQLNIKQAIVHKSEVESLNRQARIELENETVKHQINQFDDMRNRYLNIFKVINNRDKLIQDTYK